MKKSTLGICGPAMLTAFMVSAGCQQLETIRTAVLPATPHERYLNSLRHAGLDETVLGRSWIEAGETALREPLDVSLPFRESAFLAHDEAGAIAFRFTPRRGERIIVEVTRESDHPNQLFVDFYEVPIDTGHAPRHLESIRAEGEPLEYVARDRTYLLRIQPELLQHARYTVTIRTRASLAFPVTGVDSGAIRSLFGDPRDGGKRRHEGVDIFASRGTPVIAAAPGIATVRENRLGGRVVWVREILGGYSYYYAHLDSQTVATGTRVNKGDTLGLVGNTGNARFTPPHLHFGVYARGVGAVDPYPYVHEPRRDPPTVSMNTEHLGRMGRISASTANMRRGPDVRFESDRLLARHTAFRIRGESGNWYRIETPDGRSGFVAANLVELIDRPLARRHAPETTRLFAHPAETSTMKEIVSAGQQLAVLGRFDEFQFVESESGQTGWARL